MISAVKIFLSVILSVLNIFFSPIFGNFKAPFEPVDPENVKLNFAAISDTHMTDSVLRSLMLEIGLEGMEGSEQPLDALVVAGDLTDHGYLEDYEMLKKTFAGYNPAKNIILAEGNHDTWTEDDKYDLAREYFIKYNKEICGRDIDAPYYSTKINGYSFIVLGSEYDHTDAYFSDAQLEWLAAEMEKASADGLPIFVISHWPINESHGLPETWGDDEPEPDDGGMGDQSDAVEAVLKKYKNVFLISGHIHNGFSNDATSDFYGFNSVDSDGSFHSINLPSYMYMTIRGRISNGTGFQFEVYEDRVEIRARSYSADVWYTDYNYTIPLV